MKRAPSRDDLRQLLTDRRNWGRWGDDDELGAINLITDDKRLRAARAVAHGRSISLSRPLPTQHQANNRSAAQHLVLYPADRPPGGAATDYFGIACHGTTCTHVDALNHCWDSDGMWNGRDPAKEITRAGVQWADVDVWRHGITTRGVLADVPRLRSCSFVEASDPVHGWELEDALRSVGIEPESGDAVVVHCGRERWEATHGPWAPPGPGDPEGSRCPGLHASCLEFLRDHDIAMLVWDMLDASPHEYSGLAWSVHAAIWAFGVALVDNALIEPLADLCAEVDRWEFLLMVSPLRLAGGTGSPVNPIAVL